VSFSEVKNIFILSILNYLHFIFLLPSFFYILKIEMNTTRSNKHVGFKNTTRKRTYNKNSRNLNENINIPLRSAHAVPEYSVLEKFMPPNHYEAEANRIRQLKRNNYMYPYTGQNYVNVGKIMESVEGNSEAEAFVKLNEMFPSRLNTVNQATLDVYIRDIINLSNHALIRHITEGFVNKGKPVPVKIFKYYSSFYLQKYMKSAILSILSLPLAKDLQKAYIEQIRKIILKEIMRKGWFEYTI
jgi:hypothetical protein